MWRHPSLCTVIVGVVLLGPAMSRVEQAKYSIVDYDGAIEIRDYAPKIIAQTTLSGDRKEAIGQGFRVIADYIFGNNTSAKKVAMTAPVLQQESEKIAMTAPVLQEGSGDSWSVAFVMPDEYTMETLPKPNNPLVTLIQVPSKRFAVIRFSGVADDQNLQAHTAKLEAYIKSHELTMLSVTPAYAFYNPPWTLPFMRRNEVMIEVSK